MKPPKPESWIKWRSHRSADGLEYYNYPTPLAQKYWIHVLCIGRASCPPGYRHRTKSQEGFLLHYVRRGVLEHRIGHRVHKATAGEVCLLETNETIELINPGTITAQNWWILFNGRDVPALFAELRADREPVFGAVDRARFDPLFRELLTLTRERPSAYEAKSAAALTGVLAELFAAQAKHARLVTLAWGNTLLSQPVRKGIDYMIRFHGETSLGLKRICEAAGLSLHHFVRVFHHETGVSPIQYLNRYRIEQAKQLLVDTDKAVEEIARLVGTSTQNYFAYLFRKTTGSTPREFRTKARRAMVRRQQM